MTREDYDRRLTELKLQYPYLFREPHSGHEVNPGWLAIVADLCAAIDRTLAQRQRGTVRFVQIKEKFGGLRAYLSIAPFRLDVIAANRASAELLGTARTRPRAPLFTRIEPLVRDAEAQSFLTCGFCGAPGMLRRDRCWILTLCDQHAPFDYGHLDAAFAMMSDPKMAPRPPTLVEATAALRGVANALQNFGVLRLGVLPPATAAASYPILLRLAKSAKPDAPFDVASLTARAIGWPTDVVNFEVNRALGLLADLVIGGDEQTGGFGQ
jgi:hypothetical protein